LEAEAAEAVDKIAASTSLLTLVRNKASNCSSVVTTNNDLMMLCSPATKNSCLPDIEEMILDKSFLACWREVTLLSRNHCWVLVGRSL